MQKAGPSTLVLEDRILMHAWCGVDFRKPLREAEKTMKSWPSFIMDRMGGTPEWLARVEKAANDRSALDDTLASEIVAHRLGDLPTGNFFPLAKSGEGGMLKKRSQLHWLREAFGFSRFEPK